jgi:hypothetical protein
MIRTFERAAALAAGVALSLVAAACSPAPPSAPASASTPAAPSLSMTPPSAVLWGDMKPIVSVKELMKYMIDPISDGIFLAVSSTTTKKGIVDVEPKTDDDWDRVQTGAVSLAEAAYLLKVRRPFAPAGDLNNSQGPGAVELSPDQITAKVEKDPVEWNARIEAMRNVALEVLDIVKRRDAKELWDAGENLDNACESCHRSYWYPGETPEFYRTLRGRLDQMREQAERRRSAARSKQQ